MQSRNQCEGNEIMYARHWKRRMLSVAVAIAMVVACIVALDATCAYAGPISGTHRNLDRSKTSDVLIIGDSRIEMLAELNNVTTKKASYNATVGAHYIYNNAWVTGYWTNKPMVIGCPQYLKQQQAIVRNCLKRHGSCKVVIVATVNDIGFSNWQSTTVSRMKTLRRQLQSVRVKGKCAKVYFASMLPEKGYDSAVKSVNSAIKKAAGGRYINLGLNSTWKPYYTSDRCHLTSAGSRKVYKVITDGIR